MGILTRLSAALLLTVALAVYADSEAGNGGGMDSQVGPAPSEEVLEGEETPAVGTDLETKGNAEVLLKNQGSTITLGGGGGSSKPQATPPSGQPLPGALAVLALGGLTAAVMRRRRSARRS